MEILIIICFRYGDYAGLAFGNPFRGFENT